MAFILRRLARSLTIIVSPCISISFFSSTTCLASRRAGSGGGGGGGGGATSSFFGSNNSFTTFTVSRSIELAPVFALTPRSLSVSNISLRGFPNSFTRRLTLILLAAFLVGAFFFLTTFLVVFLLFAGFLVVFFFVFFAGISLSLFVF